MTEERAKVAFRALFLFNTENFTVDQAYAMAEQEIERERQMKLRREEFEAKMKEWKAEEEEWRPFFEATA